MSENRGLAAFQKVDGAQLAASAIKPMRDFADALTESVGSPEFREAFGRAAAAMKQVRRP